MNSMGFFSIEDCAEAFGTLYRDRHVGTFGDIATFSFFGNKTITTGEGGMVVTNNSELFRQGLSSQDPGRVPGQRGFQRAVAKGGRREMQVDAAQRYSIFLHR